MSTAATEEDEGLWEHLRPDAARRLAIGGLACFAERGFHATTTRDIATHAGMSPAAVYVHYPSKGELLYRISRVGHEAALETLEHAAGEETDPRRRVRLLVSAFAGWHARNHRLARVVQYELDALPATRRREILKLRQRFDALVEREIAGGVAAGHFDVGDVPGAALAVLSLCIDVARWYGPGADRTPEQVGALYAELVLRMLGAPDAPAAATARASRRS